MENRRETDFSGTSELSLPFLAPDAFSRLDESDDSHFYAKDRFVSHLDSLALYTIERLIGELVVEENPVILDLMAGWDSHLPKGLEPSRVVGIGLNKRELAENRALDEIAVKDLNKDPSLPFKENTFTRSMPLLGDLLLKIKPHRLFFSRSRTLFFANFSMPSVWSTPVFDVTSLGDSGSPTSLSDSLGTLRPYSTSGQTGTYSR
jgi:hypothetical protein